MADDFDPYYTWLGIPPEEQPADHYRLLGVRRYESNADVITNAMDQRMHYLRSLQVGKRSTLSQKILNEVSAAGVVLLDSKRRADYDGQLRAKEPKAAPDPPRPPTAASAPPGGSSKPTRPLPVASSLPKAAPLPAPTGAGTHSAAAPAGAVVVTSSPARMSRSAASDSFWKSPVVLGGAAFAAMALLGLIGVIVVRSLQTPDTGVVDKGANVTDKGTGMNTKTDLNNKVQGKEVNSGVPKNGKTPSVDVPLTPVASAGGQWWNDANTRRRLYLLEFDKRASAEIAQTAGWVPLTQNTTVEGWFKLQLDLPQIMTLFGTRSGVPSGAAPKGWTLSARRVAADRKMVDQLVLALYKSDGSLVQYPVLLPQPSDWHHVALVVAGGKEWWVFIDGRQALHLPPADAPLSVSGANLRLGDDANGRGSGLEGQVCGFRVSDAARYQKPFAPPSPLAMTHDELTVASLHFTMAVPGAAAGTIRRSVPDWKYGYGRYDDSTKKLESFLPMLEWNGLQWKPGPSLPEQIAQWMSLDPLGGHAGNGPQHAVIRRWTAPDDGTLRIAGKLTHAHESRFGDGIRARIVSATSGPAGEWDSLFTTVDTSVESVAVRRGEHVDFVVECKANNHCDKFAWQVQLSLTGEGGKQMGVWDSETDFHGPDYAGAVYQLARLQGARWLSLDASSSVAMTQLAPIPSAAPSAPGRVDLIQTSFDGRKTMRGQVTREGSALRTKANDPTAFMLSANFPPEYVLEAEVVRESGEDSICFGFPVPGNRRMTAIVDGQKGAKSGLASVNDQQIFTKGNPLARPGRLLSTGKAAVVRISVSKSAVELSVNGLLVARWKVNSSDKVLLAKGMGYSDPKALAILTWDAPFRINRLELIPGGSSSGPSLPSEGSRSELVQKHAEKIELIRGQLTYSSATGWVTEGKAAAFMIPESLPSEYVIEAEVTRQDGNASISFHLPVRGQPLSAIIDIYDSRLTGLSDINDWHIQSADNPTVHRGPVLTNGQPAQVRIVVSAQEISLSVDGRKLSSWPYDPGAKLNAYQGLRLPDPQKLGVTTGNSKFRIRRMELISTSAGRSPSVPSTAAVPIDLVDAMRKNIRSVQGSFQVAHHVLTTGKTRTRLIVDDVELPDEYTLEADVTRLEGQDTLSFGFPVQGRPLCVLIDGWASSRSGICLIPGQDGSAPAGPTMLTAPLLITGKLHRLQIVVSKQEVRFDVDGKAISRWQNDPAAELKAFGGCEPEGRKLAICTADTPYRIANLKLIPGGSGTPAPVIPPATGFAGVKKPPIPDDATMAKAHTQIAAVFGDELKGAKTPPAKATIAKKISDLARETRDLPTKYVMLQEARKLFVELKDVASAMQTVDAISQDFDVQPLPAKVKLLETIAEGTLSAAQRAQIVSEACSLGYEAIDSDNFAVAQAMATVTRTVAARATAADVKTEAKEFMDEFSLKNKRWEAVRKAEQTLAATPDDPAANLALGLYHTFERGDLTKGLPMLAKGSDARLAAAAKARQANISQGVAVSLAEADAWYDCLGSVPADYKAAVQKRALDAYDLAISSAEGLDKAKAEKRRDQLKADLASAATSAPGSKRGSRIRKTDLPESSPGLVGRVYLGGKDAGILVTFNPNSQRPMDTQKLRDLLTQAKVPGGRIVLEGVLSCPTPMSMNVFHRGASTAATQQLLVNHKVLSTVGGSRGNNDFERLQLPAGNHLVQWVIDFDGSAAPYIHIYEDGNSRPVPLNFNRDQNYGARKLATTNDLDLTN